LKIGRHSEDQTKKRLLRRPFRIAHSAKKNRPAKNVPLRERYCRGICDQAGLEA
jgi:hypothetical protein